MKRMSDSAWPLQVTAILLVGFVATRCDFQSVEIPQSSWKNTLSDKVLRNKNIAEIDTLSLREKTDLNNTIVLRRNLLSQPPLAVAPDNSVIRLSKLRLREKPKVKRTDLFVRRDGSDVFITLKSKQGASLFQI